MNTLLDVLIAISLAYGSCTAHAPAARLNNAPKYERSVWTGYTGLYKLQTMDESCSRTGSCPGIKPQLTWAPVLLKNNTTQTKGN